jgi:hypothetical protein
MLILEKLRTEPEPHIIAVEIVDNLESALEEFQSIQEDLEEVDK